MARNTVTDARRQTILRAVARGATIAAAAAEAGLARSTVFALAQRDPAFAADLAIARRQAGARPAMPPMVVAAAERLAAGAGG
jgi:hypothetical protein